MIELVEEMREAHGTGTVVVFGAFVTGIVFGVVAELSRYCTRAAVAEWALRSAESRAGAPRTLAVLFAMLAALLGTQALRAFGIVDLSETIYWSASIKPVSLIVGGLLFGIGMVLAGGCVSRLLVLAASGNGRSWLTLLVTGIAAYATLRGLLSYPRLWLEDTSDTGTTTAELFEDGSGLLPAAGILAVAFAIAIFFAVRRSGSFSIGSIITGIVIGGLVVAGWLVTGFFGADEFEPTPLVSLTFVAPAGESIQYLMIFTGDTIRFSIALLLGTLTGAFVSSLISGRFGFTGFVDERSLLRYAAGGALMGFGGVTALGCTVGQGLSGVSTMSPASFLAIFAIVAGGWATMRWQHRRTTRKTVEQIPAAA